MSLQSAMFFSVCEYPAIRLLYFTRMREWREIDKNTTVRYSKIFHLGKLPVSAVKRSVDGRKLRQWKPHGGTLLVAVDVSHPFTVALGCTDSRKLPGTANRIVPLDRKISAFSPHVAVHTEARRNGWGNFYQQIGLASNAVILVTLRAKLSVAVYCNQSCLFVCVCGFVCLWVCYHDNSKLHASIFTKLGL